MNESLHLYLNGSQALLRRQHGWPWRRTVAAVAALDWDAANPASLTLAGVDLSSGTTARLRWAPPRALYVYAGSALCRFQALDLPGELRDGSEALAAAQGQMLHQLGLQSGDWSFSLDRAGGLAKSVACAARRPVLEHLRVLAQTHGLQLVSFRPFVAAAWNALHDRRGAAQEAAALLIEHDALTVFTERAGRLDMISSLVHQRPEGLIERELRRLSYAFSGDGQQRVDLLVADTLHGTVMPSPDPGLHADFRDLLSVIDDGRAT